MKIGFILPSKIKNLPGPIYMYFEMVGLRNNTLIFLAFAYHYHQWVVVLHLTRVRGVGPGRHIQREVLVVYTSCINNKAKYYQSCKYFRRCTLRDFNDFFFLILDLFKCTKTCILLLL